MGWKGLEANDIPISSVLNCFMITLTKLQFDWLIHEVTRCECHLQYATGSLMLFVVCWISLFRTSIFTQITAKEPSLESMCNINPLSPNIHIQILQTDLHTSPLTISWENLIKDQSIFSMVIILLILITLSLDSVWILLGETCCWSLLALKGLTSFVTLWGLKNFVRNKKLNFANKKDEKLTVSSTVEGVFFIQPNLKNFSSLSK